MSDRRVCFFATWLTMENELVIYKCPLPSGDYMVGYLSGIPAKYTSM